LCPAAAPQRAHSWRLPSAGSCSRSSAAQAPAASTQRAQQPCAAASRSCGAAWRDRAPPSSCRIALCCPSRASRATARRGAPTGPASSRRPQTTRRRLRDPAIDCRVADLTPDAIAWSAWSAIWAQAGQCPNSSQCRSTKASRSAGVRGSPLSFVCVCHMRITAARPKP